MAIRLPRDRVPSPSADPAAGQTAHDVPCRTSSRALIIGAGIGGLAAAIALRQAGLEVSLVEQAPVLDEIGAGLQLTPNATRILRSLGVLDAVEAVAIAPQALEVIDGRSGRLLARCAYGPAAARHGAPFLAIHRADLHRVLAQTAQAAGCPILLDTRVEGIDLTEHAACAITRRAGSPLRLEADLLVGADGVRSTVRTQLGHAATPVFAGRVAYRASVPAPSDGPPVVRLHLGPRAHLVTYPVRGGATLNIVAVVPSDQPVMHWSAPGIPDQVHHAYAGWCADIRALLRRVSEFTCWGLYDIEPLSHWGAGRATLLGDAAHAMLPFLAQGAAQAIEDAASLAQALAHHARPELALRAYEAARRPRTARIQREARANGQVYHLAGPAALARNLVLRLTASRLINRYDWIYEA